MSKMMLAIFMSSPERTAKIMAARIEGNPADTFLIQFWENPKFHYIRVARIGMRLKYGL
jgi:hypothetical protein